MGTRSAIETFQRKELTIRVQRQLDLGAERTVRLLNSSDRVGYLLIMIGMSGLFTAFLLFSTSQSFLKVNALFKALWLGSCVGLELIGSIILLRRKPNLRR